MYQEGDCVHTRYKLRKNVNLQICKLVVSEIDVMKFFPLIQ